MSAAREPEEIKVPEGLHEGALVAGKYRVGKPLGVGGMGLVLAAVHEALGTQVALKVIHRDSLRDASIAARFVQEGRAAAQLKSDHVVRVYDLGTLDDGTPYLAMERLEGVDLGYLLDEKPRLGVEEAVEIVRQTCDALGEAHAVGIVHRDLKPQNLFLVQRAGKPLSVKVLDFGIAKILSAEQFQLQIATHSTAIMGSPVYMAPEQMRAAKAADGRSDLWSLGVIFYQLLAGKVPFEAESLPELCARVLTETAPPLDESLGLPPGLADVVLRCLENDPAKRFATAEQLVEALTPYFTTRPIVVPEVGTLARTLEKERGSAIVRTDSGAREIRPDGATVPALEGSLGDAKNAKTVMDRGSARTRAAEPATAPSSPPARDEVANDPPRTRTRDRVGATTTQRRMRKTIAEVLAENEALAPAPAKESGNGRALLGLLLLALGVCGGVYLYKFRKAPLDPLRDTVGLTVASSAPHSTPPKLVDDTPKSARSADKPVASAAPTPASSASKPRSSVDAGASTSDGGGTLVVTLHDAAAPSPSPSSASDAGASATE